MAIQKLTIYRNPDTNANQLYLLAPNGAVSVYKIDDTLAAQLAGMGVKQTVTKTNFQPAYGGETGELSGQSGFDKLKGLATTSNNLGYAKFGDQGANTIPEMNQFRDSFSKTQFTGGSAQSTTDLLTAQSQEGDKKPWQLPGYQNSTQAVATSSASGQPITLPNGQVISPQDPNYAAYAAQSGSSSTPSTNSGTSSTTSSGATSSSGGNNSSATAQDPRAYLQSIGIDPSGLDDNQVSWLSMMGQYQDMQAKRDGKIAPPSLSPADLNTYLQNAKAELDPAFQQQFDIATKFFNQAAANLTGDFSQVQQDTAIQQQQQMDQLQQQQVEAGLARSGLRAQAEERLKQQQEGVVTSQRRQAQNQAFNLGGQFEQQFGVPGAQIAQGALSGIPGGFVPLGVKPGFGTLEQQHNVDVINRQSQMAQAALGNKQTTIDATNAEAKQQFVL